MSKFFDFFSGTNKHSYGVTKTDKDRNTGIASYFKLLKRSIGKLTGVNILFFLVNFPVFLLLFSFSGNLNTTVSSPGSTLYAQLYGIMNLENTPITAGLYGIIGYNVDASVVSTSSEVLFYVGLILLLFTFGIANVGFFYILRNVVNGQYISVFGDFFRSIKNNFKKAFLFGVVDLLLIAFLVFDFISYRANAVNYLYTIFYYTIVLIIFVYFLMRFYIYIQIVSFDLTLRKIIKNSLYLVFLGAKRNFIAILTTLIISFANFYIFIFLPSVGSLLIFIFTISLISFTGTFCSFPVIKDYIIEPYYTENPDAKPKTSDEEPIFTDRG